MTTGNVSQEPEAKFVINLLHTGPFRTYGPDSQSRRKTPLVASKTAGGKDDHIDWKLHVADCAHAGSKVGLRKREDRYRYPASFGQSPPSQTE